MNEADWERRVSAAWASIDQRSETDFLALIEELAAELPPDSGVGLFERAASFDSNGNLGQPEESVALAPHLPRYQRSLASYARLLAETEPDHPR